MSFENFNSNVLGRSGVKKDEENSTPNGGFSNFTKALNITPPKTQVPVEKTTIKKVEDTTKTTPQDTGATKNPIVKAITGGSTLKKFTSDFFGSLPESASKVSGFLNNWLINKPAEQLAKTKFIKEASSGIWDSQGNDTGNTGKELLKKLSYGTESISGLTGGVFSSQTEAPEDITDKVVKGLSSAIGTVAGISTLTSSLNLLKTPEAVIQFADKYPKVAKYAVPLFKNAVGFSAYGQLDPQLANNVTERLKKLGLDLATSVPYTFLGGIKSAKVSIPASFGLGFGLAKMSGASNEDAIISGTILGMLDGFGRAGGEGKHFISGREVDLNLKNEARDVLNEFSDVKITSKSTPEEIKTAFRKSAMATHPDRTGGDDLNFKRVNSAYQYLMGKANSFSTIEPKDNDAIVRTPSETKNAITEYENRLNDPTVKADIVQVQSLEHKINDLTAQMNSFHDENKVQTFSVLDTSGQDHTAVISVSPNGEGKFLVQVNANTLGTGLQIDFSQSKVYKTEELATEEAKKQLVEWAKAELKNPNTTPEDAKVLQSIIDRATGNEKDDVMESLYEKNAKKQKQKSDKAKKEVEDIIGRKIYKKGDKVEIDGTEYTITSILDKGADQKLLVVPENGNGFWTNLGMLKLAEQGKKEGKTVNEIMKEHNEKLKASRTQKEVVKKTVEKTPKSIKQIAKETGIKEPNIRRILGVGAKEGTFERVDDGVYVLSKDGQDTAWVETGNAMESLPRLAESGFKADMVFLDIPYDTPAVKGGNRGVKYDLVSVEDFGKLLDSVKKIAKTKNSPVIHMYSQAESGMKAMQKYNYKFLEKGFKPVGKGEYQKTFADGSPVTSPNGKVSKPEGILVFTLSGELNKDIKDLNFTLRRPKGYQTEKPAEMLKTMIEMTTEEGDMVLDPFAGSGVTGAEAVKAGRKSYNIEKNPEVSETITKPRIKKALEEKKTKRVLPSTKKKEGLVLKPSTAKTEKEIEKEKEVALGDRYSMKPTIFGKIQMKKLIASSEEFKNNPVLIVDENKDLTFTGDKINFKLKASGMGLNPDALKVGDEITVDINSLKATGAQQQLRGYKDGIPVFKSKKETERFISSPEVVAELKQYFNDGEIPVNFVPQILMKDGGEAWAKYEDQMMTFVENTDSKAPSHETVHAYLDLFVSPQQKQAYIMTSLKNQEKRLGKAEVDKAVRDLHKQYNGSITLERAKRLYGEEVLADDFIEYIHSKKASSLLKRLFDKVLYFLRRVFNTKGAKKLYEDILTKKRDFDAREIKNTKMLERYLDRSSESVENANKLIAEQAREVTLKIFNHPEIKGKETFAYTFLDNLNKSTSLPLKAEERAIIKATLELPEFKNNKKINVADFKKEVVSQLLPLEIIRSSTYASYGSENIGLDGLDNTTYILNSPFQHDNTGHFNYDFYKNLKSSDLEIKEIPVSEQNPTPKFAILKKGVTLTEENINQNVFTVANTQQEADMWIKTHTLADDESGESISSLPKGLFSHFRSFDDKSEKISHIAEVQSDAFQKDIRTVRTDLEYRIADKQRNIDDYNKMLEGETDRDLIFKEETRLKTFKRELEDLQKELADLKVGEFEKSFLSYQDIWAERTIREAINIKAKEGFEKVRFPTARTVAVIEGFSGGEGGDIIPYEHNGDRDTELEVGDTIDYGGEEMTVLEADVYTITVAPSKGVHHFDADDAMQEDIQSRWDEAVSEIQGLEKDFGKIDSPEKAQEVLNGKEIYDRQVRFNNKKQDIEKQKEYLQNRLNSLENGLPEIKKGVEDNQRFIDLVEKGFIKKEKITERLDDEKVRELATKYNLSYEIIDKVNRTFGYWSRDFNYETATMEERSAELLKKLNEDQSTRKFDLKGLEKNISDNKTKTEETIKGIEDRVAPTKEELKKLSQKLREQAISATWEMSLDWGSEQLLERMAESDEESFELDDFESDFKDRMAQDYDADYEGMYGKGKVFYQEKGYGNTEVWITEDETEQLNQPSGYDQTTSVEDFNIGDYSGNQLTVLNFYEKQANRYLQKLRKGNIELVSDDNGYEWYETNITPEDKEAVPAYMAKKKIDDLRPVEMPELVRLARQISGMTPTIKEKLGNKLGYAKGGKIVLRADQFKEGNEYETAKLLAHEIGHVVDWLPDYTTSRGNLIGHILTLRKFMASTFNKNAGEPLDLSNLRNQAFKEILASNNVRYGDYVTTKAIREKLKEPIKERLKELIDETGAIKNSAIKAELIKATEMWSPYDKTKVPARYIKYRESPKELYAEAISMLLVNPDQLRAVAPTFFTEFFDALDEKPIVKADYFELQELLYGNTEQLFQARKEDIRKGFGKAEELQKGFAEKRKSARENVGERLRQAFDDVNYPLIKAQRKAIQNGATIAPADNVEYTLQEELYANNDNYIMVNDIDKIVLKPLEAQGMTIEDLGEYLLLDRIQTERKDIANPYGFNQSNAGKQLEHLKNSVGEENYRLLEEKVRDFHDIIFKSVEEAVNVGFYSKEKYDELLANKYHYSAFQVVDYLQDYVPAGMKKQIGTLKEVANPAVSTILKTVSLNRMNARQRSKNSAIKGLKENYPDQITPTKVITTDGKLKKFVPANGMGSIEVFEDGKLTSYDVDPYIAESFNQDKTRDLQMIANILQKPNNIFKPLVTTFNLGFSLWNNPQRDFKANYKKIGAIMDNLRKTNKDVKKVTVRSLLTAYAKSLPSAYRYSKGELDEFTRMLVETKAMSAPLNEYNYDPREDEFGRTLEKFHITKTKNLFGLKDENLTRILLVQPVEKIILGLRSTLNITENISKIAGARILAEGGMVDKELAYKVRNFVGTPNYKTKGTATYITNELFPFSNIMKEGIKSDYRVATNPKTRSGYWWRTVKMDLLPKALMFLLAQTVLKEFYDDVSEYDKTNYLIIPLGWYNTDATSKGFVGIAGDKTGGRKAVYMRIPHDEMGRLYSAVMWKLMSFAEDGKTKNLQQILEIGAGQFPSLTPSMAIPTAWVSAYMLDKNPYDAFRGRSIVDDTTFQAGGLPKLEKMVQWSTNNFGLTKFATFDTSKNTSAETFMQVAPWFSSVIKISNYGQKEKLMDMTSELKTKEAKQALTDREIINKYVDKARQDKSTIFSATKYGTELIKESLGGHMPKNEEESKRADSIMLKFKRSLKRGLNEDPQVDAILSATTNAQKVAIIKEIKSGMSPEEFTSFRNGLLQDKIVSTDVIFSASRK